MSVYLAYLDFFHHKRLGKDRKLFCVYFMMAELTFLESKIFKAYAGKLIGWENSEGAEHVNS